MTNRERVMQELAAMNDQALFDRLTNEDSTNGMMNRVCFACEAKHGGKCPGGNECIILDGSWLRDEWDGEPLMVEVET